MINDLNGSFGSMLSTQHHSFFRNLPLYSFVFIIVNLEILQKHKVLSHTPITCNSYNCKYQRIESGTCSDISGFLALILVAKFWGRLVQFCKF